MASPYCDRFNCFASLEECHSRCQMALSRRRSPCQHRRPRRWADLPHEARCQMHGNWLRTLAHQCLDRQLAKEGNYWVREDLQIACRRYLRDANGKRKISVPVGLLERLLRIAEVSEYVLAETRASTALSEGQIAPNSVRE